MYSRKYEHKEIPGVHKFKREVSAIISERTGALKKKKNHFFIRFLNKFRYRRPEKYSGKEYGQAYDYKLFVTIIIVCCFGLIMVCSSSAYNSAKENNDLLYVFKREGLFMIIGGIAMWLISKIDYHKFAKLTYVVYLISVFLMLLVNYTPLGVARNGEKRWLNIIPGVKSTPTYQPTEFVKIGIILLFALLINKYISRLGKFAVIIRLFVLLIIPGALVASKNLSSGIIILGIGVGMYFIGSRYKKPFVVMLIICIVIVIGVYINPDILTHIKGIDAYQIVRIRVWKDPSVDPLDKGYQVLHGLYAIGSGGLFGKGLGASVEKLGFLPESHNDMIFSIICEELGAFGALCVMGLFAYMIYRFMHIILKAPDLYGALLVSGVMVQIALQVVLNIAVVINLLPNTGISLPFISYGGTSVTILLAEMGIVLGVSNQIIYEK